MYQDLVNGNEEDAALFCVCYPKLGLYNLCLDSLYVEKLVLLGFILNTDFRTRLENSRKTSLFLLRRN